MLSFRGKHFSALTDPESLFFWLLADCMSCNFLTVLEKDIFCYLGFLFLFLFFNQNMTFTHNSNKFNPFNQKCLIRLLIQPPVQNLFYLDILLIHELTYKVSHHQHKQYVSYLVIGFGKGRQRKVIKIYRQMCETHVGGCTQDACLSTVLITGCQVSDNLLSLLWMLAAVYSLPVLQFFF